jgi:4-hydroxybenzoate polyprenyltransferase
MHDSMIIRWRIYINEMFLPYRKFLYTLLIAAALGSSLFYALKLTLNKFTTLGFIFSCLLGCANYLLLLIFYRSFDEFKDVDIDKVYFPNRPIPSGRVLLNDLLILMYISVILVIIINLFFLQKIFPIFLTVLGFSMLMRYNFFMFERIANNRILAFVSHSPISFLANIYLLAIHLLFIHQNDFELKMLLHPSTYFLALWFYFPGAIREVAKKTYAPSDEVKGYQTYSTMLGLKGAILFALAFWIIHLAMTYGSVMGFSSELIVPMTLLILISIPLLIVYGIFWMRPEKIGKKLLLVGEYYTLTSFLLAFIWSLIKIYH